MQLSQDQKDLIDAMMSLSPIFGRATQELIEGGADLRTIAPAFATASKTARGWVLGRLG